VEQFIIYVLGAFVLMLVITLASMDYAPSAPARRRVLREVFAPLIGVLIGSALTIGFTLWTSHNTERAEMLRAARSVAHEVGIDIQLIDGDLDILRHDNEAADQHSEIVRPLSSLLTSAGETAYLHGSLDLYSKDMTVRLGDSLASLSVLNNRIEGREMYRLTNQAMDNYSQRRRIINTDMQNLFAKALNDLTNLFLELNKVK
jgi:hypothetical protein